MESRGRGALSGSPSSGSLFAHFLSKNRKWVPVRHEHCSKKKDLKDKVSRVERKKIASPQTAWD
jgi:hypothetical protein